MKTPSAQSCPICANAKQSSHRSSLMLILSIAVTVLFIFFLFTNFHTKLSSLEHLMETYQTTPTTTVTTRNQTCPFPVVYNKPHKTGSTKIKMDLVRWSKRLKRPVYSCSPYIDVATLQMRECVPEDHSGCAVVATHVIMSPYMRTFLRERIGDYLLITSTRNPRDRLISRFLQDTLLKAEDIANDLTEMKEYFRHYNPWKLYNYQTGANIYGACPMSNMEKRLIPDAIIRADVVMDVDLGDESQEILTWKGLFNLTEREANVRGSKELELDKETELLIKNISCVEEEMHRLYRLRMAGLYEHATGKKCIFNQADPTTCFDG